MVVVVVVCAGPERQEVSERPGEVVARVGVDGLEESERDPDVHRQDVQVLSEEAVEERAGDGALGEDEDLERVGVLGGEADGGAEGCESARALGTHGALTVVLLVDVLVQRAPVKRAVRPVVERVLEDEEEGDLGEHERDRGERNLVGRHAKVAADRVEEVDQWELAGEVREEDVLGARPNLLFGDVLVLLQLPLVEVWDRVNDEPWDAAAKVDDLGGQHKRWHVATRIAPRGRGRRADRWR